MGTVQRRRHVRQAYTRLNMIVQYGSFIMQTCAPALTANNMLHAKLFRVQRIFGYINTHKQQHPGQRLPDRCVEMLGQSLQELQRAAENTANEHNAAVQLSRLGL